MVRFLLVTALMLGLGFATSAQAGTDEAWRIVQSAGDVRVSTEADAAKVVDPRTELPEGAIETINDWAFERFGESVLEVETNTVTIAEHLRADLESN